jgi:signal transduction histidine kinase
MAELTLRRQGIDARCLRVDTAAQMLDALARGGWDAIVSDWHLPGFSGDAAIRLGKEHAPDLPILIVSGTIGEDVAVAAMREGADDYLIKGRLARLGKALENAIDAARTRAAKRVADTALRESQAQLQALSAHLQDAIETERTTIARELHDEIGSGLTALRYDLAWIERHPGPDATARAAQAQGHLADLLQACQRIVQNLRPPVLDSGLLPALQWQAAQFRRRAGLPVHFDANRTEFDTSADTALIVYRTLQEGLTNIAKHAQATQVRASLVCSRDELSLELTDDGVGIDPGYRHKTSSFGLRGLAERARRAGGLLEASRGPRGGTSLLLSLPIHASAEQAA